MSRIAWPAVVEHAAQIVLSYDTGVTLRQLFAPYFAGALDEAWRERLREDDPAPLAFEEVVLEGRVVRHDLFDYDASERCLLVATPGNGAWSVEGRFADVYESGHAILVELRLLLWDETDKDEAA